MPEPSPEQARELAEEVARLARGLGLKVYTSGVLKRFNPFTLGHNYDRLERLAQTLLKESQARKAKRELRKLINASEQGGIPPGRRPGYWARNSSRPPFRRPASPPQPRLRGLGDD